MSSLVMKTHTNTMGAANTTAAQFVVKYVAHPVFDPTEREATISDDAAFSEDQIAAKFVTRHGGSIISVARVREPHKATRRPIKVGTCYTTADENGVAVIGAMVTWNDGESGEMTWPNTDAFSAFQGRYYYGV